MVASRYTGIAERFEAGTATAEDQAFLSASVEFAGSSGDPFWHLSRADALFDQDPSRGRRPDVQCAALILAALRWTLINAPLDDVEKLLSKPVAWAKQALRPSDGLLDPLRDLPAWIQPTVAGASSAPERHLVADALLQVIQSAQADGIGGDALASVLALQIGFLAPHLPGAGSTGSLSAAIAEGIREAASREHDLDAEAVARVAVKAAGMPADEARNLFAHLNMRTKRPRG